MRAGGLRIGITASCTVVLVLGIVGTGPLAAPGGGVRPAGGPLSSGTAYPSCFTTAFQGSPTCMDPRIVYDPVDSSLVDLMVCLGGPTLFSSCTWSYANGTWTNLTSSDGANPPATISSALVWDSADEAALLVGGFTYPAAHSLGTTWEFQRGTWTNTSVEAPPEPDRLVPTEAAYDPATEAVIAVWSGSGPIRNGGPVIWSYGGGAWTNLTDSGGSLAALPSEGTLVPAPSGSGLVSYGGFSANGDSLLSATWQYANGSWQNRTGAVAPPPLFEPSIGYDPFTNEILLVGGTLEACDEFQCPPETEMWEYAGEGWTNVTSTVRGTIPVEVDGVLVADPSAQAMWEGFGTVNLTGQFPNQQTIEQSSVFFFANGEWTSATASGSPVSNSSLFFVVVGSGIAIGALSAAVVGRRRRRP